MALTELGHVVFRFDTEYYFPSMYKGFHSLSRKIGFGPRVSRMNHDIATRVKECVPDLVWIDKGLLIAPKTLASAMKIPSLPLLIHYSPDDMMNPANQTRLYLRSVPLYDIHITTKTHNLSELKELGARRIQFMDNAYSAATHRPMPVSDGDREMYGGEIGFVGWYEKERASSMNHIAECGLRVRIWGPGWRNREFSPHSNLRIEDRSLWAEEYTRVICSTDVNLGFLRKINRDRQTSRSIEIPACGGFMIAERTEEHIRLFKEDEEAVFFSSDDELAEKSAYYIRRPDDRVRIARAGYKRCLESGYSNVERLGEFFRELNVRKVLNDRKVSCTTAT
jgi:hypothetical protein